MNRFVFVLFFVFILDVFLLKSQESADTSVFLITCSPGTETYSIYGHSALRIVIPSTGYDMVYNWGVFDFNTPNFVWKFARGRLEYMLGVYPWELFLREYFLERRSVYSQKVNISGEDLRNLLLLLEENLKPENIYYRYDFFYDNCSTRIRDIFEKIYRERLIYAAEGKERQPTFRDKISEYQRSYPWLKAGVDFSLGLPADKKTSVRDRMFLPEELMRNLAKAEVRNDGRTFPLLQTEQTVFEFEPPFINKPFYTGPMFILGILFIIIMSLSIRLRNSYIINYVDILIFAIFSLLSLLLVFFNFITDHSATRINFNLVWISPVVIFCLVSIIINKPGIIWFRIVFWLSVLFLIFAFVFISKINGAFIPAAMILALRSSARSDYSWCSYAVNMNHFR